MSPAQSLRGQALADIQKKSLDAAFAGMTTESRTPFVWRCTKEQGFREVPVKKHLWRMAVIVIIVSLGVLCAGEHCWAKQSPFGLPQTKAKADDAKDSKASLTPKTWTATS